MDSRDTPVSAALIVIGTVVLSVGISVGTVLLVSPMNHDSGTPLTATDTDRLEAIEWRLEQLERTKPLLRTAAPIGSRTLDREPIDRFAETVSLSKIEQRLAALEGHIDSGDQFPFLPGDPDAIFGAETVDVDRAKRDEAVRLDVIASARAKITDRRTSVKDKLYAHASLRRVEDAYTPGMVHEMIQIGLYGDDAQSRAQVWTTFDGSSARSLPVLIPNLIDALRNDSSAQVRSEAAETLGNFPRDAAAIAALEYAAKNDATPNVRRKALRTLKEMRQELTRGR